MSLSPEQRIQTAQEFSANVKRANLEAETIRQKTGLSATEFESAYTLTGEVNPVHVWLVRDVIYSEVKAAGHQPLPFAYLPERMRVMARIWFGVRDRRY